VGFSHRLDIKSHNFSRADKYPENQLVIPAVLQQLPSLHLIAWKNVPELLFFNENNLKYLLVFRS
jgi:hypothetical protein